MSQCTAKTKKGKQCENSAVEGDVYCHIHRVKPFKNIIKIVSRSALLLFILGLIGFLANITGLLSFFGIDFNSLHTPKNMPALTLPIFTPTPNAFDVDITRFGSEDFLPIEKQVVNLDGHGPDELIVRNDLSAYSTYAIKVLAYVPTNNYGDYTYPGNWEAILTYPMDLCDYLDYGIVDLKKDGTKQIVIFRRCGSGSFVYLDVFGYRGLRTMETIYVQNEPLWQGFVRISNEAAYIVTRSRTLELTWNGSEVVVVSIDTPVSSSTESLSYWRDGETIKFSAELINLRRGETLHVYHDAGKDSDFCDPRVTFSKELEQTEYSELLIAVDQGESEIYVYCWAGNANGRIKIVIDSFP